MWGECATRFETDNIQTIGQKEPIIAIFVGTLPKTFKGNADENRNYSVTVTLLLSKLLSQKFLIPFYTHRSENVKWKHSLQMVHK